MKKATSNSPIVYSAKFTVKSYEVGFDSYITLSSISKLLQECAWTHAEDLKVGYSHLIKKKLAWALSKKKITVLEYPKWSDNILIETWPTTRNDFFCYRDFAIKNDNAETIIKASTEWLAIDLTSKKIARTELYFPKNIEQYDIHFFNPKSKIEKFTPSESFLTITPVLSDIDVNMHVNNARYIDWILDSLDFLFNSKMKIAEFEIQYISETKFGETVKIYNHNLDKYNFIHSIKKLSDNSEVCRARSTFIEREII